MTARNVSIYHAAVKLCSMRVAADTVGDLTQLHQQYGKQSIRDLVLGLQKVSIRDAQDFALLTFGYRFGLKADIAWQKPVVDI